MPLRRPLAAAYRLSVRPPTPEDPVEVAPGLVVPRFVADWSARAPEDARRLVDRLLQGVDVPGRSVVAVGRGAGDLGIELARRGAQRVVAVDMAPRLMALAQRRLATSAPDLPVEMFHYGEGTGVPRDGSSDLVVAVDALRSYGAARGSRHVEEVTQQLSRWLVPGGLLAVRFGPSWKAPYGGGVDSRLPWAHLLFPQSIVFDEFRRVRPGSQAAAYEDIGINRITLGRFHRAMEATGLQCLRFETNVTGRRALRPIVAVTRMSVLADYLTFNAFGLWRDSRPATAPFASGDAPSTTVC